MSLPAFFAEAPRIRLRDPLAEFLGASDGGLLEYGYADAVRLAGHSCPTVASAYLMARAGLRALFGDAPAVRGAVSVTMNGAEDEGTTGVIAQVFTLLTGAAADNGFHGIGGRFIRQGLLRYDGEDPHSIASFRRNDNGDTVYLSLDLSSVPPDPQMRQLMPRAMAPDATPADRQQFGAAWQERVRRLLLEHADDAAVIRVERRG
ncbi:hypothetical protein GPROT2_03123 [Gammaproteobacteria bacterium]|nr:MAG: hypothetical protein HRU81_11620 [Gammaproteobacteria bacterium]CAG0945263.1 hypothetical protein GPROT2_03123 [Gammaproteobacteria bacterium]